MLALSAAACGSGGDAKTGTKINGLGDEAYDEGEYVEVRVGDAVLRSNENSGAGKDFINALYRAMIPNLN